jgi:flagellar hook protein FlgE
MSLFGAMSTAISGLNAQSAAFANISDNTANSQTVGFKGVETSFIDYLSSSSAKMNQSGSVGTKPDYLNNVQGTVQQSYNPLAMAINGQGFFRVSEVQGATSSGVPNFSTQNYYTRTGDFQLDSNGFLVNSAGEYLNGWSVDATTGVLNTSSTSPIQVQQTQFQPVATANVSLLANVPTTPSATSTLSSNVQIYDATGTAQQFNANGTLGTLSAGTGSVTPNGTGNTASVALSPSFNGNSQTITLNLGQFNTPNGVTQFAGTDYNLQSITQDGAAPGSFTGISTDNTGAIYANFNNGRSVQIAEVPIITFENPDALQRQNGEAFTTTTGSGVAISQTQNQNGAGTLVTGSVEASNVDIATQLSHLIVAQQAYGANAKVIATANQMLTTTLDIKQ